MTHGHPGQPRCRWCGQRIAKAEPPNTIQPGPYDWFHVADRAYQCARWDGRHTAEPIPELHEATLMQQVKEFVGHHQHLRRSLREAHQARASATRRLHDYQALVDRVLAAYEAIVTERVVGEYIFEEHDGRAVSELVAAIGKLRDYRRSTPEHQEAR